MLPKFPPRLEEWLPGDPTKKEPPLPRWLIKRNQSTKKLRLYHGTEAKNVPSIMAKGILPRTPAECEQRIDKLLAGYGLTREEVPEKVWKPALLRCMETTNKVYLSPFKQYAMGECLSGLQDEYDLRSSVILHKEKLPEEERPEWEQVLGKRLCKVCEVEVPVGELYLEEKTHGFKQIKQELEWLKKNYPEFTQEDRFEVVMGVVNVDKVPPEWIKICDTRPFVGPPGAEVLWK